MALGSISDTIKLQIQFINIACAKNKAFFVETFGFALFYSYIFIGLGPRWREKLVVKIIIPALDVFRRGKNSS